MIELKSLRDRGNKHSGDVCAAEIRYPRRPQVMILALLAVSLLAADMPRVLKMRTADPASIDQNLIMVQGGVQNQLKGINFAGNDGYIGKNSRATVQGINYYLSQGLNVFRLMERWETLQPTLGGPLDSASIADLDRVVNQITTAGARVIIDAHQGGRRKLGGDNSPLHIIGEDPEVTSDSFADFWVRMASHYKNNGKVIFNLQNEPHDQDTLKLVATYNKVIAAIRKSGASNLIIIDGNTFTGGTDFFFAPYDRSVANAVALLKVFDGIDKTIIDIHQYFDGKNGGTQQSCELKSGLAPFKRLTDWARQHHKMLFFGEFGFGNNDPCFGIIRQVLGFIAGNKDVWLGWTYFAAYGGATPYNVPDTFWYNVDPADFTKPVRDRRLDVLREFLP